MGLIQVALGSISSTLRDQYKEFIYCDSLSDDVLFAKGIKHESKGSHNNGNDGIITKGSTIAVADGQCMLIVEKGQVIDYCAVPGAYTFDQSSEVGIFSGNLGEGIKETFKTIGRRISYGGDTANDQRVYYFNIKEIKDNKFGTANPIPFRIVDSKIGLDVDISVRCNGAYSYKITNPMLFYTNVCGNVQNEYTRQELEGQLKTEFLSALQPAFAEISELEIRPSSIPAHTTELCEKMNKALSDKWAETRGITIVSVGINSVTIPKEDEDMIKDLQKKAVYSNATFAAGALAGAQAEAMVAAANNSAGAMNGFMGVNMAAQAGGMNAQNLFAMGQQQAAAQQAAAPAAPSADSWTCSCGAVNTGKFCSECASPKPAPAGSWTCSCGTVNTGKFCSECASPKPSADWTCSCGAVNTGKFCSECAQPKP